MALPSDSKLTFNKLLDKNKTERPSKKFMGTSYWNIQSKVKYFMKNIKRLIFF